MRTRGAGGGKGGGCGCGYLNIVRTRDGCCGSKQRVLAKDGGKGRWGSQPSPSVREARSLTGTSQETSASITVTKTLPRAAQKGGQTTGHSAVGEKKLSHEEFVSKIRKELSHFGKGCS